MKEIFVNNIVNFKMIYSMQSYYTSQQNRLETGQKLTDQPPMVMLNIIHIIFSLAMYFVCYFSHTPNTNIEQMTIFNDLNNDYQVTLI